MTPVGAIAVVALHRDHRASCLDDVLGLHVAERLRDRGPRVRLVRGAAEAAADQHIESGEIAVIVGVRDQPEIVRVDVDAVVALDGDRGLELARQVALAVERVRRIGLIRCGELAVEPDLAVCARGRREPGHERRQRPVDLAVQPVAPRRRAAHDVAFLVAAAAQRGEQRVVDGADRPLEVALEHPVQLQVLPGRDPQRPVPPRSPAMSIVREIRVGAHDAARDSRADHHHVVLVAAELSRFLAQVTIILLIHAVELEDHAGVVAEDRASPRATHRRWCREAGCCAP